MTTYADNLIEAMATGSAIRLRCRFSGDSARCRDCQLGGVCKVSVLSTDLAAERAALVAALKFMIEHGPSESMDIFGVEAHATAMRPFEDKLRAADNKGWLALACCSSGYVTRPTFVAMCRALLAELEGP